MKNNYIERVYPAPVLLNTDYQKSKIVTPKRVSLKTSLVETGAGFTLIETLIYLALFGIIIGGVSAGVYAIIEGAGRTQTKILLQEEGDFLTAKINWALGGASDILITANPPSLKVDKFVYANNPLVFNLSGSDLTLSEGAGAPQGLNPAAVKVGNLTLQDIPGQPEGVSVSFTLSASAQNGSVVTQDFEVTKYLRN